MMHRIQRWLLHPQLDAYHSKTAPVIEYLILFIPLYVARYRALG